MERQHRAWPRRRAERKRRRLWLLVALLGLAALPSCAPALRRTEGGSGKALATVLLGLRIGDELNEGRKVWWPGYLRPVPVAATVVKVVDCYCTALGWTSLERARYGNLDPPASYEENLLLLREAHDLGLIDKSELARVATKHLVEGSNANYASLRFAHAQLHVLSDERYKCLLKRIRWDRDYYVYPLDYGLVDGTKGTVPEHQYRQQILLRCATERRGKPVKPIPWALRAALREGYMTRPGYESGLRGLLKHLEQRLQEEHTGKPLRRGRGGISPFLACIFVGSRVGYHLNEGRRIRGIEYYRVVPVLNLIADFEGGLAAYRGRTGNLAAWDSDRDPLAVRQEWVDLLDQCRDAKIITPARTRELLKQLATGSYTTVRLLRKARDEEAISIRECAELLQRVLREPDWPINPLNEGALVMARRVGLLDGNQVRQILARLVKGNYPSFSLLRSAYHNDVVDAAQYREGVQRLYKRIYR